MSDALIELAIGGVELLVTEVTSPDDGIEVLKRTGARQVNDPNVDLKPNSFSRFLGPDFYALLIGGPFVGLGAVWYHYVGSLTGYFLALIIAGLATLVIGTTVYAAVRLRRG